MKWFILLLTMLKLAYSQTSDCGTIGNPFSGSQTALRRSGVSSVQPLSQVSSAFFLDTSSTAVCSGNVTSWRYCYFPTGEDYDTQPRVQFAIYRLNQTGNSYFRVSPIYTASGLDIDSSTDCRTLQLGQNVAQVQTGDVIGACIFGQSSNPPPLYVIGDGATEQSLMDGGACGFNSLPDSTNQLTSRNGLALLIFADQILQDTTVTTTMNPLSTGTMNPEVPLGVTTSTQNPLNPDGSESEADLGLRGNSTITETPGSVNLGIVTAIVVVVLLAVALGAVVMIFVYLLAKHCRKTKPNDDSEATASAFSNLELSSHAYDFPSLTTSMKLEQRDFEASNKEHIYDYAKVHKLERSEYVSMHETDMGLDPAYSLLEDSNARMDFSSHLERNKREDIYGSVGIYAKPASAETELYAQLKSFGLGSIPVEDIRVTGHLGSGYFGQVEQGVWINGNEEIDVAMKTLNKQVVRDADQIKFLQEAAIMAQFRHPNIVTLYGITCKKEPMMLVLELVDRGNLKDYLLFVKPSTGEQLMDNLPKLLLKFSQQVALGMQYLSARGYIHRDLAARNVLVNKHGICKITDFGMSRDLAEEDYYVANNRDAIPVKWTAPEALYYKKYSTASDVWSYGCLLYEIWSLGHTPFAELSNREVIRKVSAGRRPAPPPGTPKSIYELMIRSWNPNTSDRPKFREMVLILISEEEEALLIPPEALSTHMLAGVIGSPLEAGIDMYPELELTYIKDA